MKVTRAFIKQMIREIVMENLSSDRDAEYLKAVDDGDTKAAQKMVDEAAKKAGLVRSRHATGADFTSFDRGKIPDYDPDTNIRGFHFSTEATVSTSYRYQNSAGNKVMDVYLDIGRTVPRAEAQRMVNNGNHTAGFPNGFDTVVFLEPAGSPTKEQQDTYDRGDEVHLPNGYSVIKSTGEINGNKYESADLFRTKPPYEIITGYNDLSDAFSMHDESHVVVKSPNQIKSADPVTYDDQGNPIPLSQRFNEKSDDIRKE
jgi:hypothetical protein